MAVCCGPSVANELGAYVGHKPSLFGAASKLPRCDKLDIPLTRLANINMLNSACLIGFADNPLLFEASLFLRHVNRMRALNQLPSSIEV